MFVPKYLVNCNAYQPSFQFSLCFSYEDVVEKDDISRTVKEVVEEVNIFKYIDFSQYNAHGYDAIQMFEAVILAFAINGDSGNLKITNLDRLIFTKNGEFTI